MALYPEFGGGAGNVYRGNNRVGRVEDASNRYYTAGAALLLVLGRFIEEPRESLVESVPVPG